MSGDDERTMCELPDPGKVVRVLRLIARATKILMYILPALTGIYLLVGFATGTMMPMGVSKTPAGVTFGLLPFAALYALAVLVWLGFVWFFASYFAAALGNAKQGDPAEAQDEAA